MCDCLLQEYFQGIGGVVGTLLAMTGAQVLPPPAGSLAAATSF
jgi:hypothetical protein